MFTDAQIALLDRNAAVVEARRLIRVDFATVTLRLAEASYPVRVGSDTYLPGHGWISAAPLQSTGPLEVHPAIYRVGALTPPLIAAHMGAESEWRGAVVVQSLQMLADRVPVGPLITLHRGRIADIRRPRSAYQDYFEIRAEPLLRRINVTPLGQYTDRDQQARSPGDRLCEYVAAMDGKVIKGWLKA